MVASGRYSMYAGVCEVKSLSTFVYNIFCLRQKVHNGYFIVSLTSSFSFLPPHLVPFDLCHGFYFASSLIILWCCSLFPVAQNSWRLPAILLYCSSILLHTMHLLEKIGQDLSTKGSGQYHIKVSQLKETGFCESLDALFEQTKARYVYLEYGLQFWREQWKPLL